MSKSEALNKLQQNIFCDELNEYFNDKKSINELYFEIKYTYGLIHLFKNFDKFKESELFLEIYANDLIFQKNRFYANEHCHFPCFIPTENKNIDLKFKIVDKLTKKLLCSKKFYRTFYVNKINYNSTIKNEIIQIWFIINIFYHN